MKEYTVESKIIRLTKISQVSIKYTGIYIVNLLGFSESDSDLNIALLKMIEKLQSNGYSI